MNIEEFAEEFRQEVLSRCQAGESGQFREDQFTEIMLEYLAQADEIEEGEVCYHRNAARGEKLNAYNLYGDGESVDLFVSLYRGDVPPESVPQSEVANHFRWLRRFLDASLRGGHRGLEESAPVFDVAQQLHASRQQLSKARLFFLTDGVTRSVEMPDEAPDGIEIQYFVWDIEKLRRFISSRMKRDAIEIDFVAEFGGGIPCLEAPEAGRDYKTFLAFIPGEVLSRMYDEYGPRLLEKNVRSYLQARGKVNKGIRATILNEPGRFLAYNNGISATAESVIVERAGGAPVIRSARDFQIVNGGQTTASIHHAFKHKASMDQLAVQLKLTVLSNPAEIESVVPLISQYANSQNKVNAADFSANHPFHIGLEELSRRVWAPAMLGTERQTHWYYERARGSYLDDKGREGTPARMRAFEIVNPLCQKFTKTDLAKVENTWSQLPYLVCLGAEKNFIRYTATLAEKGYPEVDENYFQRLVAKAILFRAAEKAVAAQQYGGFRAQIVAYTLSWLSRQTAQRLDLTGIWREQGVSEATIEAIVTISRYAYDHIVNPPQDRKNPGEWSKREDCWSGFSRVEIQMPPGLPGELLGTGRSTATGREGAAPVPEVSPEITAAAGVPATVWFDLSHWAKETGNLEAWQRRLAFSLGRRAAQHTAPTQKQAVHGLRILDEALRLGFRMANAQHA